jgi:hypothetical protein
MHRSFWVLLDLCIALCISVHAMFKVGQNRIYTPYMTVYMVNSLPKIPYTHRMYMVLANPSHILVVVVIDSVGHAIVYR